MGGGGVVTNRIFVYGTLAPGRPNEHVLSCVSGTWEPATVRGTLVEEGWGAAAGYPGIVLSETAGKVHGLVFTSTELAAHWDRLDAFEGDGYVRLLVVATLASGDCVDAYVYALSRSPPTLSVGE